MEFVLTYGHPDGTATRFKQPDDVLIPVWAVDVRRERLTTVSIVARGGHLLEVISGILNKDEARQAAEYWMAQNPDWVEDSKTDALIHLRVQDVYYFYVTASEE